ncbi:MAG: DEAD/DEAH box helicase, partial [Planctomycetota bacterium]
KTVVAVYAMLAAVAHEYQAALMAPTEVLARQHFRTIDRLLEHSQVRRRLLVGGLSAAERERTLHEIASGEIDLVVGTQALIQRQVQFAKLGVVVIDEQHKFGVRQRAALRCGNQRPHCLIMTATPIPRTLTMLLFGDLDVSVLRDAPPGRKPVHTYLVQPEKRKEWWGFVRRNLDKGRQAYVVVPLVEESESGKIESVESVFTSLRDGELAGYDLGVVHGRLSSADKADIMERFHRHELDVLICTSVVEVGIDVPNATVMTIINAERFGLAQLHQLRGRISRGKFPGYCGVFAESETPESQERLKAFVATTDGFELAEIDFRLRGPGEILGTRQHGIPPFRIADLLRDAPVAEEARRDAQALVEQDPDLRSPEHALLRKMVLTRYGKTLDLGDVG